MNFYLVAFILSIPAAVATGYLIWDSLKEKPLPRPLPTPQQPEGYTHTDPPKKVEGRAVEMLPVRKAMNLALEIEKELASCTTEDIQLVTEELMQILHDSVGSTAARQQVMSTIFKLCDAWMYGMPKASIDHIFAKLDNCPREIKPAFLKCDTSADIDKLLEDAQGYMATCQVSLLQEVVRQLHYKRLTTDQRKKRDAIKKYLGQEITPSEETTNIKCVEEIIENLPSVCTTKDLIRFGVFSCQSTINRALNKKENPLKCIYVGGKRFYLKERIQEYTKNSSK